MDDRELLRDYVENGSDQAFATLVDRYVGLVYSAAVRQVGSREAAEDVTQVVFVLLARKAGFISSEKSLAGWLYRAACHQAARFSRTEQRRRQREDAAASMKMLEPDSANLWEQLAPQLDGAINQLSAREREPILLRYFQRQPLEMVGQALGISDDAARMRINRALDKLRGLLSQRGVACSKVLLSELLLQHAVEAVPNSVASAVQGAAQTARASTFTSAILWFMVGTKVRRGIFAGFAVLVAVTTGMFLFNRTHPPVAAATESPEVVRPSVPTGVETPVSTNLGAVSRRPARDPEVEGKLNKLREILYSPIDEGGHPSSELRKALEEFKPNIEPALALLLEAMENGSIQEKLAYLPQARAIAGLAALGRKAEPALPALMAHARKEGAQHRSMVIWHALPLIRPEPALAPELIEIYRSGWGRDGSFRDEVWMGIETLVRNVGASRASEIAGLVAPFLQDPDGDIRFLAASAMALVPAGRTRECMDEIVATLKSNRSLAPGDPFRYTLALRALQQYGRAAEPALPAIHDFLRGGVTDMEKHAAKETIAAINAAAPPSNSVPVRGETLAKEVKSGSRTIGQLAAALQNEITRVQAARALNSLGPKAAEALPKLYEALLVEDDVFRQLVVMTIKKVAPDQPSPLLDQSQLAIAMRAVADHVGSTDPTAKDAIAREINRDLQGAMFYDHSFLVAVSRKLRATDPVLSDIFIAKLLEIDPPLERVFQKAEK